MKLADRLQDFGKYPPAHARIDELEARIAELEKNQLTIFERRILSKLVEGMS